LLVSKLKRVLILLKLTSLKNSPMIKKQIYITGVLIIFLILSQNIFAQNQGPGGPDCWPPDPDCGTPAPADTPIGGGVIALIVGPVGYGAKKIYGANKI